MPNKLDFELLQKLVSQGKLKKETLDSIPNFADGGVVPEFLKPTDPLAGVIPDVGTMQVPSSEQIASDLEAQGRSFKKPFPGSYEDAMAGMTPEQRLISEDPGLAQEVLAGRPGLFQQGADKVASAIAENRKARLARAQGLGVDVPQSLMTKDPGDPMIAGENGQESGAQQASYDGSPQFDMSQMPMIPGMGTSGAESQYLNALQAETAAQVEGAKRMNEALMQGERDRQQVQAAQQLAIDEQTRKVDAAIDTYMTQKIDPDRFFANKTTGNKIGMALGLFFSGLNGSNTGMQLINNMLDRDIEAQKSAAAQGLAGVNAQRGVYSDMLSRFQNENAALHASKLASLSIVENQFKQKAFAAQGSQQYAQAMMQFAAKKQEAGQKFMAAIVASPQYLNQVDAQTSLARLGEDDRKRAVIMPGGPSGSNKLSLAVNERAANDVREALPSYDALAKIYRELKGGASAFAGPQQRGRLASLKQQALLAIKGKDKTGALDKGVQELFDEMIGDPTSLNQPGFKGKLMAAEEMLQMQRESFLSQNLVGYKPLVLRKK